MGKFSTGVLFGAMLGAGMLMIDKKSMKKAKKIIHNMHI